MGVSKTYRALGLMSGTSLDAIDVALIETDGQAAVSFIGADAFPYDKIFRTQLRACLGKKTGRSDPEVAWVEDVLTKQHALAIKTFLHDHKIEASDVDLIGFHGHTLWHNPAAGETIQIGDGAALAAMTGIDVVNDLRSADVKAGGQGAPLVPLYHRALAQNLPKPLAILNIGGVANITWIGGDSVEDLLAFDTGTGNALLDDWVLEKTGKPYDAQGALAAQGRVDESFIQLFMHHPYFTKQPPKSLDRDAFMNFVPSHLGLEDGAATLAMMSVKAVQRGLADAGLTPRTIYLTGGGRHNDTIRRWLGQAIGCSIENVDDLGWRGDSMEAEAFAYLAVRSLLGLPLTLPRTTRAPQPMTGGTLHRKG